MSQIASQANFRSPQPAPRFNAKGEELNAVPYRNGDIFVAKEDGENVMVDTVRVVANVRYINLVSLDRMYDGDPVEYKMSEQMLLEHYQRTGGQHPHLEGDFSFTMGD